VSTADEIGKVVNTGRDISANEKLLTSASPSARALLADVGGSSGVDDRTMRPGTRSRRTAFSVEASRMVIDQRRKLSAHSAKLVTTAKSKASSLASPSERNLRRTATLAKTRSKLNLTPQTSASNNVCKDPTVRMKIKNSLSKHVLFKGLSPEMIEQALDSMQKYAFDEGDTVLEQGSLSPAMDDNLYYIESGTADVVVHGAPEEQSHQLGDDFSKLFTLESLAVVPSTESERVVATKSEGSVFGEVALLFVAPRTADVVATSELRTWSLSRRAFQALDSPGAQTLVFLRELPLFQKLTDNMLIQLAPRFEVRDLGEGETVIRKGDAADALVVVKKGAVAEMEEGSGGRLTEKRRAEAYDFLGDLPLLSGVAHRTTYNVVEGPCTVLLLKKQEFNILLPLLRPVLDDYLKFSVLTTVLPFLPTDSLEAVVDAFKEQDFLQNDVIAKHGQTAEMLLIVKSGEVAVKNINSGKVLRTLTAYDYFVDQAMSNTHASNEPGTALVVASRAVKCMHLSRQALELIAGDLSEVATETANLTLLRRCPQLSTLKMRDLQILVQEFREKTFKEGEYILRQGEKGDKFYVLRKGEAVVTKADPKTGLKEMLRLKPGDQFGERALLFNEPRAANVIAATQTEVMYIQRESFEKHLGPLKDIMETHVAELEQRKEELAISFTDLEHMRVIGVGMFGQVRMVKHKYTGNVYALKIMRKELIVRHGQQEHVKNERAVMQQLKHWSCVELKRCFRDRKSLYVLLEMVPGGELFRYLDQKGRLSEPVACFYAAQVLIAMEQLHSQGVVYRDLKPENLLIDQEGYLKMVDFGFAKKIDNGRTYTICGTPDYQSPEVILRKGHGMPADCWSVGILIYEMLAGRAPFKSKTDNPRDTFRNILQGVYTIPMYISDTAADIIMQLLQDKPPKRLGYNGLKEIRQHPFFKDIDWVALERRAVPAPYIPTIMNPLDTSNFDAYNDVPIDPADYDDIPNPLWEDWDQAFPRPVSKSASKRMAGDSSM